jgi:hypothetical protein
MRWIDFLLRNPLLLLVALAWIAGVINNAIKAKKKADENRRRREQQRHGGSPGTIPDAAKAEPAAALARQAPPPPRPVTAPATRQPQSSPEQIAQEMRRLLGLEPDVVATPTPTPPPPRREPRRMVVEPERAPQPVMPSAQARRLPRHIDPHVGEGIQHRHVDPHVSGYRFGTLGGRAPAIARSQATAARFALEDLKKAFILSEILAPPLALRPFDERRLG